MGGLFGKPLLWEFKVIQGIIAAVGLGASVLGGFLGNSDSKQQAQIAQQQALIQQQINQQQQASIALQQKAADIKYKQDLGNLKASAETVQQQQQAEGVRRSLMELDARRKSREAIRDMIIARANAIASGSGKGVNVFGGGDSSIAGSVAQIQNRGYSNVLGINQSLYGGRSIFDINKNISDIWLTQNQASQGYLTQSFGLEQANRGIQANVFNLNSQQAALGAQAAKIGSDQAFAQGISNIGGTLLGNATGIGNVAQSGQGFLSNLF